MPLAQLIEDYWRAALHERATRQLCEDQTMPKNRDWLEYLSSNSQVPEVRPYAEYVDLVR